MDSSISQKCQPEDGDLHQKYMLEDVLTVVSHLDPSELVTSFSFP